MTNECIDNAQISERAWNFPANSSTHYKGDFGEPGSAFSLSTGCESFTDNNGNKVVPHFAFKFTGNPPVISCGDIFSGNSQDNVITTNCSNLSFQLSGDVDLCITNIGKVDLIGVNCDSGL